MNTRKAPVLGSSGALLNESADSIAHVSDRDELVALAATQVASHTGPVTPGYLLAYAITYAANGWEVFPLRGKMPAVPKPHRKGSEEDRTCQGECGLDGHGVYDATIDLATICRWWAVDHVGANIGLRPPAWAFILDNDPKKPDHVEALANLVAKYGPLPTTLTNLSGRLDGGRHRFYRRPQGKLSTKRLGPGFDIKDRGGYVVAPPSIHPDTGWPYLNEISTEISDPGWLTKLIVVPVSRETRRSPSAQFLSGARCAPRSGQSPADAFCETHTWADVLMPHGWACLDAATDGDGARWLHPAHTSQCSATIRHGCLFVYSTNTPFEPTGARDANGYTKFRAYAVLNHGGDLSAAAKAILQGV